MEKKAKQFDRIVGEWKGKVDRLSFDLDVSQKETRNASSELFKVKSAYEETVLQLEEVRRENKTLSNEIKDIMDQITEGGRSIHEIDKIRKRLEAEKMELQSALEEAEATLEQEENKVLRCQMELAQVKQVVERRIAEDNEEFAMVRKAQTKGLDSMQSALETEAKGKAEALRMKKKLEADAADLGLALEHAIAGNAETQSTILEEESLFPKATDKSFEEKLKASLGKLPIFLKPASKTDKNAHFGISHYAGIVNYNVTGWLEKNKDPVNDTAVEVFKSTSKCELLVLLWADHPGQPTTAPKDEGKKKKKGGGGKTVSSVYLVSLTELMTTLHNCAPHFVRCLVPNTHKKPGEVEPPLIMHQLTCNGVLEGIRICMRGFPNRMLYPDYKMRYACLGQAAIKSSEDNKTAVYALMDGIPFDRERYRLGHTLVFFRAGSLGALEEERDKLVIKWVRMIQGEAFKRIRGYVYKKKYDQRELIKVGQRNFRKYLASRDWGWFVLIQKTRATIGLPNPEEELRLLEEKANATWGKYKEALDVTANLQGSMDGLKAEIGAMSKQLEEEQGNISVYTDRQTKATASKVQAESELKGAQAVLSSEENSRVALAGEVKAHSGSVGVVKKEIEDIELAIAKVELEKGNRDHSIKVLQDEIADQDEVINKRKLEGELGQLNSDLDE